MRMTMSHSPIAIQDKGNRWVFSLHTYSIFRIITSGYLIYYMAIWLFAIDIEVQKNVCICVVVTISQTIDSFFFWNGTDESTQSSW
jgi:hypothetical protein